MSGGLREGQEPAPRAPECAVPESRRQPGRTPTRTMQDVVVTDGSPGWESRRSRGQGSASLVRFQVQEARLTSGSADWDAGTRAHPVLLLSPRLSQLHRLCYGEASIAPSPLQDWKGAGDFSQSRGLKEHGRVVTVNTRPDPSHFPGSPSLCPLRSARRAGGHGA